MSMTMEFVPIDPKTVERIQNLGYEPVDIAVPEPGQWYYNPQKESMAKCKKHYWRSNPPLFIICNPVKKWRALKASDMLNALPLPCRHASNHNTGIITGFIVQQGREIIVYTNHGQFYMHSLEVQE